MTYCEVIYSKDYIMMNICAKEKTSLMLWVWDKRPTAEVIQVQQDKSSLSGDGTELKAEAVTKKANCSETNDENILY